MRILLILVLVNFLSCVSKSDNKCKLFTSLDFYNKNKLWLERIEPENAAIEYISDRKVDDRIGGEYVFFANGNLKQYKFFSNHNHFTFMERYDDKGKLVETEGSRNVFTNIEEVNEDSISFNYYIYNWNVDIISLKIVLNNADTLTTIVDSTTLFSNTEKRRVSYNARGLSAIQAKSILTYRACDNEMIISYDSIFFNRRR